MKINRRNFNSFLLATTSLTIAPSYIIAAPYNGPINWAGTSFLLPFNRIKVVMPITKKASELTIENSAQTFFNASLMSSLEERPIIENLDLDGLSGSKQDEAKLALTLSFASEFDFGGFKDTKKGTYNYFMRVFAHTILYNPGTRNIVASVPVRARIGGAILLSDMREEWKTEVMKFSFYNEENPEKTILDQFRIMTSQLSLTNRWKGRAPRVTSVTFPEKKKKLFNENLKLNYDDFLEFLGHSCTAAFSYTLNQPIIPFSITESAGAVISVFKENTKMFQELETDLPKTDIKINLHHKGWKFKEKPLTHPILQITLYIGLKLQIIDVFADKPTIYTQHFSAQKRFIETIDGSLRSDANEVCYLTEALLERAFLSIIDEKYRKKIAKGEIIKESDAVSFRFKLNISKKDPDYLNKTIKQSKTTIDALKTLK